jgi:hypothetical protein
MANCCQIISCLLPLHPVKYKTPDRSSGGPDQQRSSQYCRRAYTDSRTERAPAQRALLRWVKPAQPQTLQIISTIIEHLSIRISPP